MALFLLGSAVFLVASGVALYVAPSGRVARTVNWRLLWLGKDRWEAVYTLVGFAFLMAFGFHLKYNWRSILAYIRRRTAQAFRPRKELARAALATLVLLAASVYDLPPVTQVMGFGESLNDFWERWGENRGFYLTSEEALYPGGEERADENEAATTASGSKGYGRLTVEQLAKDEGISVETAIERLAAYGVEAGSGDSVLALGGRYGYTPKELMAIVRGEDPNNYGE